MSKTWIAVNAALLLLAGALGWQLHRSVERFRAENDVAKLQPARSVKEAAPEGDVAPARTPQRYDAGEFMIIPEQNLFSETRAREDKTEAPAVVEAPTLSVKPVLVGVTIMGDQRLALVHDPANPGAGRRALTRRIGDSFQGYTITEITEDRMVLENGSRREIIPLHDGSKPAVPGSKTPILATRVVAFGGGAAAGGAAAPVVTVPQPMVNPAAAQARPMPQAAPPPVQTVVSAAQAAAAAAGAAQSGITRSVPQQQPQVRQVPGTAQQPLSWNERIDEQGRRVIRTPFGDIIRENKPPEPQ